MEPSRRQLSWKSFLDRIEIASVICLAQEANTPAKGRNIGVRAAYGNIVALTDGDCIAEKDWLRNLVEYLPKERGIVANSLKHFKRSKILDTIDNVSTYLGSGRSPQFFRIDKVSEVSGVPSCNMAIQKGFSMPLMVLTNSYGIMRIQICAIGYIKKAIELSTTHKQKSTTSREWILFKGMDSFTSTGWKEEKI
jgi:hypothetical protein